MNYILRLETENDYDETECITREAFWDVYRPGCMEHLVVHKLRKVEAFVKGLDYVACDGKKIVGNIMYSKAKISGEAGKSYEVLCLGPVTVLPVYQKKGIGSLLINTSIQRAKGLKYKGVFLYGNPNYYSKFGFADAVMFNVQTSEGENAAYFMGLELSRGSMKGISGRYYEDSAFQTTPDELEEFEKRFPAREKHVTDTQLK